MCFTKQIHDFTEDKSLSQNHVYIFSYFMSFILLINNLLILQLMISYAQSYLLGLGEPLGGSWGNPRGPPAVQRFKTLYKNPLEIPKGIPS